MERRLDSGRYSIPLVATQITAEGIEQDYEPVAKWNKPLYGMYVIPAGKPYKRIADMKGMLEGIA